MTTVPSEKNPMSASPQPAKPTIEGRDKDVPLWQIWLASIVGSTFLTIADLLINKAEAVTPRVGTIAAAVLGGYADSVSTDTLAFLVMLALGIGLCFVWEPRTRPGGFGRGAAVIAVLAGMNVSLSAVVTPATADTIQVTPTTVVSTCKPRSYGPFGLGSALNRDAKGCWSKSIVTETQSLSCNESVVIGGHEYCAVSVPSTGQQVWVER